ncbi:ribonuclease P protein subunit p29 [Caerostris darwini]|uniref:Ribonuclease P protein subunit p29 n=1 Tax=Caerostris darwini TaxID=1538125 RepID=A0AAV4T1L9_9ARAC|nr:ribonuclease P protein subunit p29 [Caerostris darwini]
METPPCKGSAKKKEKPKNALLKTLPPSIQKLSDRIGLRQVPEDYIKKFLNKVIPKSSSYTLDEYKDASEQRKLGVFKLDPKTTKYENFLPIHKLWCQYIQKMLNLRESLPEDLSGIYQKLLKADYHGCMLVVLSSVCHTYVGTKGIVIQETKNVFRLVDEEDKLKTIPKKGSIFSFELNGNVFKIYGDNFCFLPYERIRVKFKTRQIVNP